MEFCISIYGDTLEKFLSPCIYSIRDIYKKEIINVCYYKVSKDLISKIQRKCDNVFFYEFGEELDLKDKITRIGQKPNLWKDLFKKSSEKNILFLDVDMLLIKNVDEFFNYEFDIGFTYAENYNYPINTGVLLVKKNNNSNWFFDKWNIVAEEILGSDKRVLSAQKEYGAIDQASLCHIMNTKKYSGCIYNKKCLFWGFNCFNLNNFFSGPITSETFLVHYKSGWHSILFDNTGFTKKRPEETSLEMYNYFKDIEKKAKEFFDN